MRGNCLLISISVQFSCSVVSDSVTPWTAVHQASLCITKSWSLLKLMSIKSVIPSNHLILYGPLLLLLSIFPSIRVFSNESVLHIRWPKYWRFSFSISPSNENSGLISFRMDWFPLGWTDWISLQAEVCHYLHYLHHSLASGQITGRECSPSLQQKIGLKIYWAWPRPSEKDLVFPSVSVSHQEAFISLLSFSIRGQTEWKLQA